MGQTEHRDSTAPSFLLTWPVSPNHWEEETITSLMLEPGFPRLIHLSSKHFDVTPKLRFQGVASNLLVKSDGSYCFCLLMNVISWWSLQCFDLFVIVLSSWTQSKLGWPWTHFATKGDLELCSPPLLPSAKITWAHIIPSYMVLLLYFGFWVRLFWISMFSCSPSLSLFHPKLCRLQSLPWDGALKLKDGAVRKTFSTLGL